MKIKKNKLILISSEFPPLPGGIGNHAYNLAKYLTSSGYFLEVITPFRLKNIQNEINYDKQLNFPVNRYIKKNTNYIISFFKLIKKSISSSNTTFIASGMVPLIICGFLKLFFKKSKIILIAHGLDINPKSFFFNIIVSIAIKRYDLIIANSNYTSKIIQNNHRKESFVINNGIDLDIFNEIVDLDYIKTPNLNKLKIVTVGTISDRKGQKNIIKIIPQLLEKYKNISYHIIGLPNGSKSIIKLAKQKNILKNIFIHGVLSNSQMIKILKSSDVFMMLSEKTNDGDYEGFGIALIEANYLGLPAIGSRSCGLSDSIINGKNGFLVNPENDKEIIYAFDNIIKEYKKFSTESRFHARKFIWGKVIMKYIKLLNKKGLI